MKELNLTEKIYFYDDRGKYDILFLANKVLFEDEHFILFDVQCLYEKSLTEVDMSEFENEGIQDFTLQPILLNKKTLEVLNKDYDSWLATNDITFLKY
jgi:hypothetical protein